MTNIRTFVNPKNKAVAGPLNDWSVISFPSTSFKEKADPVSDAAYSSFLLSIDKNVGNRINKKITKQPTRIEMDVFSFINDIMN